MRRRYKNYYSHDKAKTNKNLLDSFDSFERPDENGPHAQTGHADAINEEDVSNSGLDELEQCFSNFFECGTLFRLEGKHGTRQSYDAS